MSSENLIQCADHQFAPWHIMCKHLFLPLPADQWVKIELRDDDGREVDGDWICKDCDARLQTPQDFEKLMQADLLAAVCMHCCNDLKRQAGFPSEEEEHEIPSS